MRGKECSTYYFACFVGITPACAGKRFFSGLVSRVPWDHPRMCGEKLAFFVFCPYVLGSPPHMRGKGRVRHVFLPFSGITPAHAGKSSILVAHWSAVWDHPRTCGEKSGSMSNFSRCSGSPPHMRGKVPYHDNAWFLTRITPAHAGKSHFATSFHLNRRDHPRTCGEKRFNRDQIILTTGSPPHMRGKERPYEKQRRRYGITPAHAGKSSAIVLLLVQFLGSPPHMRGKGAFGADRTGWTRITPAHAGKRLKRSRSIVPHAAIVPLFPSVCNKPAGSDGSPAGHDAPPFLPIENAAPASPAYNLRSL